MKPLCSRALIALTVLLVGMPAAAGPKGSKPRQGPTRTDRPQNDRPPLDKKVAIEESLKRFTDLSEEVKTTYPKNPEFNGIITQARAQFEQRAQTFLPEMPYKADEADAMKELVEITVRQLRAQVALQHEAATTNMASDVFHARQNKIQETAGKEMVGSLINRNMAPMLPKPEAPVGPGLVAGGIGIFGGAADVAPVKPNDSTTVAVGDHEATQVSNTLGAWNGGYFENDPVSRAKWEEAVGKNSLIVILGVKSTRCAISSTECTIDPPQPIPAPPVPVPGTPIPPGGPVRPPSGGGSGGITNENAVNEVVQTIVTKGGTNALASGSLYALRSGDYARAASAAQIALAFDPGNRTALEVFNAAKGRVAATGAIDAGAANLGQSAADAGAFPGALRLNPAMSAIASAGAARLAQEQAIAGAQNALKLRDAAGAVSILSKALAQDPDNALLLHYRASAYSRLGRWEDSLRDTAAGLKVAPGNGPLLGVQALAQNRTRRWRDALASSDAILAADPRSAWAYAARAHARGGLGDRDGMLADINRAAALDPNFKRAAAEAASLQLPMDSDTLFLFPGEPGKTAAPAAAAGRGRSFSIVMVAGIAGGLLFALGLLSVVLKPVKDSVVSVFTKANRTVPVTGPVATAQPASAAGHVAGLIRGQYEISRQIGQGGMGTVYEGTDRSLGRRVAIKKMRDELRLNPRERDRFIIEAKTVASLHHPNIVDIYAIAEEGDDVYLVFEFVDGKTVHDLVQTKGRLEPAETLRVTRAMGEALTYAHSRGVIHRDMKPSNVMLTPAGQIKVMDFGIARMAKDAMTRYSMTNTVVGTPPYMAPEQEQGVVRKESDVYSLAICAYEMLTGKLPFIGMGAGMLMNKINMSYVAPSRAIAGLPEALDEVFLKAFQADPDRRYRTPQEFVKALAAAADGARSKPA